MPMHRDSSFVQHRPQTQVIHCAIFVVDFLYVRKVVAPVEGISSLVRYCPQKSLDMPTERFLALLRFEQRGKLEQLGIEIPSIS